MGRSPSRILMMKVGVHAGEAWEAIVNRKMAEERAVGVTWWGYSYGGSACHPRTQVQPFASADASPVTVVFVRTPHDFLGTPTVAREYSLNGSTWQPVPDRLMVTGSKFALVLRSMVPTEESVDLGLYELAVGPKAGTPLPRYLRNRLDKACAVRARAPSGDVLVRVVLRAELAPPFAVPEEVRWRRRSKKVGKAPHQVLTGHVQASARGAATRRPSPVTIVGREAPVVKEVVIPT